MGITSNSDLMQCQQIQQLERRNCRNCANCTALRFDTPMACEAAPTESQRVMDSGQRLLLRLCFSHRDFVMPKARSGFYSDRSKLVFWDNQNPPKTTSGGLAKLASRRSKTIYQPVAISGELPSNFLANDK